MRGLDGRARPKEKPANQCDENRSSDGGGIRLWVDGGLGWEWFQSLNRETGGGWFGGGRVWVWGFGLQCSTSAVMNVRDPPDAVRAAIRPPPHETLNWVCMWGVCVFVCTCVCLCGAGNRDRAIRRAARQPGEWCGVGPGTHAPSGSVFRERVRVFFRGGGWLFGARSMRVYVFLEWGVRASAVVRLGLRTVFGGTCHPDSTRLWWCVIDICCRPGPDAVMGVFGW